MYDDTKCEEEEQLEGQRWSLKAIALTFESSKRQSQYRSGIQAAYVVAGMCSCTVFCSSFFNTHVHFIYSNWCVTQTLTLNIQEWKKGKKYSKKKKECSSMENSRRKIEKAGRGNLVKFTLFIYCTSQFRVSVAGMVNISVS